MDFRYGSSFILLRLKELYTGQKIISFFKAAWQLLLTFLVKCQKILCQVTGKKAINWLIFALGEYILLGIEQIVFPDLQLLKT